METLNRNDIFADIGEVIVEEKKQQQQLGEIVYTPYCKGVYIFIHKRSNGSLN
jgi:hypothetical protein